MGATELCDWTRDTLRSCRCSEWLAKGIGLSRATMFFRWFDSIVGRGAATYHTAGALGYGERGWIIAKLPEQIRVCGDDVVDKDLLLSNNHDGEGRVQLTFTPIRVVCQNTLTMAVSKGDSVRVSHTTKLAEQVELAKKNLDIMERRFRTIEAGFYFMARVPMVGSRLDDYLSAVFPDSVDTSKEPDTKRVKRMREQATGLFETGQGNTLPKVRGALWAAYNGVTELIDHHLRARSSEPRLDSIWFGSGASVKAKAHELGVKMGKNWRN